MSISLKTHKMLWGRAANRCAFPECRQELIMASTDTDDEALVGEECHIVAKEQNGPRGDDSLTTEGRDKYNNLILLCCVHHTMIDKQPNTYTAGFLRDLKAKHEEWVKKNLGDFDSEKQKDDEKYAAIIDKWAQYVDFASWENWCFGILGGRGQPKMSTNRSDQLEELASWLLKRIWPERYPELEAAFDNFFHILKDFNKAFHDQAEIYYQDMLRVPKFQLWEWNPELYKKLNQEYAYRVELMQDLAIELTRALNYVNEKVRKYIDPTFYLEEGFVLAATGPLEDDPFSMYTQIKTIYRKNERVLKPYPGLEQFKKDRMHRDFCIGGEIQTEK